LRPDGLASPMIRVALFTCLFLPGEPAAAQVSPEAAEFFEKSIRPVLVNNCIACHGPKKQQAELRLDSKAGLLKGSDSGPVIVAGDPEKSLLIRAIRHTADVKMPPKSKLPEKVIADLTAWVKMGAPWPATQTAATSTIDEVR